MNIRIQKTISKITFTNNQTALYTNNLQSALFIFIDIHIFLKEFDKDYLYRINELYHISTKK